MATCILEFGFHSFVLFFIFSTSVISFLVPLSISFLERQRLTWLGGDACAREIIRKRLLPDGKLVWLGEGCSLFAETYQSPFFPFKVLEFNAQKVSSITYFGKVVFIFL